VRREEGPVYEYKVVPLIGQIRRSELSGGAGTVAAGKVATLLQGLLDEHCIQGWEFYCVEGIHVWLKQIGVPAGVFDQVIFRREKAKEGADWLMA